MCLPSTAPTQWGRFHTVLNSLEMRNQSACFSGGLRYRSFYTDHIAVSVSWIMLLTVTLPILYGKLSDCWPFPLAKYRRVGVSLSAGPVASLILFFFPRSSLTRFPNSLWLFLFKNAPRSYNLILPWFRSRRLLRRMRIKSNSKSNNLSSSSS